MLSVNAQPGQLRTAAYPTSGGYFPSRSHARALHKAYIPSPGAIGAAPGGDPRELQLMAFAFDGAEGNQDRYDIYDELEEDETVSTQGDPKHKGRYGLPIAKPRALRPSRLQKSFLDHSKRVLASEKLSLMKIPADNLRVSLMASTLEASANRGPGRPRNSNLDEELRLLLAV